MNPTILAKLFQAHTDALQRAQQSEPLSLAQDPGQLQWGQGDPHAQGGPPPDDGHMDFGPNGETPIEWPDMNTEEQLPDQGMDDREPIPGNPQDTEYQDFGRMSPADLSALDAKPPLGGMFGQHAAAPSGPPAAPPTQGPMGTMFDDPSTQGVQWGPNPYPSTPAAPPPHMRSGRRMSTR